MLETSWLWFVISKEYVKLTRPKIESRDPIFFAGTRSRSRVSGNDRLFPRGSEFGPNLEIPAGPAIQLRPGPGEPVNPWTVSQLGQHWSRPHVLASELHLASSIHCSTFWLLRRVKLIEQILISVGGFADVCFELHLRVTPGQFRSAAVG